MATDTATTVPSAQSGTATDYREDEFEQPYDFMPDDFDALEDLSFGGAPGEEGAEGGKSVLEDGAYNVPSPGNAPKFALESFDDKDTPEERIDALFDQMAPHRKMLLAIMSACTEPCDHEELEQTAHELQAHRHSVYSPTTFCKLLERAGALEKTDESGASLEGLVQEPEKIEIDGMRYWAVAPAPQVHWTLTAAGAAKLESENPRQKIRDLFDSDARYLPIYAKVLELCARDDGASIGEMGKAVDGDPLLQHPRYYAMRFVDKLEAVDALDWQGSWKATDAGKDALAELGERIGAKA